MATIGQWHTLMAVRETPHGLVLDGGELGDVLMPTRYLPEGAAPGEEFKVFVHLDSEDRPVGTTEQPLAIVGQFACLKVLSVNARVGAFLDWGLAKDLLLPFAEQLGRVRAGQRVVVAILIDERSNRIVASMRTNRHLDRSKPAYDSGEKVELLIAEKTPLGFGAIINHRHQGLLYHAELSVPLDIGQTMTGYVRKVRHDGKVDLSLSESGPERVTTLSDDILESLRNNGGFLKLGDKSSPEEIQRVFGASKRAFKQATGGLYKKRRIIFEGDGMRLVE